MGCEGYGLDYCLSDGLVAAALKNQSSYTVTVQNLTGYLAAGSNGINHGKGAFFTTLSLCPQSTFRVTGIAIDGVVKLLTVTVGSQHTNKTGCAGVTGIPRTLVSLVPLVSLFLNLIFARIFGIQIYF